MFVPAGIFEKSKLLEAIEYTVALTDRIVISDEADCSITFNRNGTLSTTNQNGTTTYYTQWITPNDANIGEQYEVRLTESVGTISGAPADEWIIMNNDITWTHEFDTYAATFEGLIELRPRGGDTVASANVTLQIDGDDPTNPLWAYTALLLHFDTGPTPVDSSQYAHVISLSGTVVSATDTKFGAGCLLNGGAPLDKYSALIASVNAGAIIGTGDFTLEFWFRRQTGTSGNRLVFENVNSTAAKAFQIITLAATPLRPAFYTNGVARITTASDVLVTDTYVHVALCRVSGVTRLFVAGNQIGSNYTDTNSYEAQAFRMLGNAATGGATGRMDELRLLVGHGLYTTNFTPPTEPFLGEFLE